MKEQMRAMVSGRRGLVLLACLGLLAIVSLSSSFSGASFTASVSSPGNVVRAGTLSVTEPKDGSTLLSVADLRPGGSVSKTITFSNTGDTRTAVALAVSDAGVSDVPGLPALSDALVLSIADVTGDAPRTLWSGPMRSLADQELATLPAGGSMTLRITLTFPQAAARPGLQKASTSMRLRFCEESL